MAKLDAYRREMIEQLEEENTAGRQQTGTYQ